MQNESLDVNKENNIHKKLASTHHTFDIQLAAVLGCAYQAIIFHHIAYWVNFNERAGKNFHEGRFWMYQTLEEIANHFPYLTVDQVRHKLDKLTKIGIVIKGNFNKIKMDRTVWYTIDFKIISKIWENYQMHMGQKPNPDGRNPEPIPDTKTNTKTNTKNTTTYTPPNENPEIPIPEPKIPKPKEPDKPKVPKSGGGDFFGKIAFNHIKKEFENITPEVLEIFKSTFPRVDVDQQLKEMRLWLMSNTHRSGTQAFITKWLKKSMQDVPKSNVIVDDTPEYEVHPEFKKAIKERNERDKKRMEEDRIKRELEEEENDEG